jgi:malonyl CoA-acyl carrier protein transacylase
MKRVENAVVLTAEEYEALEKAAQKVRKGSRQKSKEREKLCCSKKVLVTSWTTTILLTLTCLLAFFLTEKDATPLATVAGLSWGVTAAVTAVYSWKAKAENKIKLTNIMVKELADKYGIEAVVSLLGISLSD